MEIQNIIFDMGQVLIHWSAALHTERFGLSREDRELMSREVFQTVEWIRLDRGTLSLEEAAGIFRKRLPERLHGVVDSLLLDGWWNHSFVPIEGMEELTRELKKNGYGLYLLSNATADLRSYFQKFPAAGLFEGLLISAEEKLLKPQHEIYELLFRRFGLCPESCCFIDDSIANIEGALVCGMPGILFRGDVKELRRQLRAMGIRCNEA